MTKKTKKMERKKMTILLQADGNDDDDDDDDDDDNDDDDDDEDGDDDGDRDENLMTIIIFIIMLYLQILHSRELRQTNMRPHVQGQDTVWLSIPHQNHIRQLHTENGQPPGAPRRGKRVLLP